MAGYMLPRHHPPVLGQQPCHSRGYCLHRKRKCTKQNPSWIQETHFGNDKLGDLKEVSMSSQKPKTSASWKMTVNTADFIQRKPGGIHWDYNAASNLPISWLQPGYQQSFFTGGRVPTSVDAEWLRCSCLFIGKPQHRLCSLWRTFEG